MLEQIKKLLVWINDGHRATMALITGSVLIGGSLLLWIYLDFGNAREIGALSIALVLGLVLAAIGIGRLVVQAFAWSVDAYIVSRASRLSDKLRKAKASAEIIRAERQKIINELSRSTVFFSDRFSSTFPGIVSPQWFGSKSAIGRLSVFFSQPCFYKDNETAKYPVWCWMGHGNLQIYEFQKLTSTRIRFNITEYSVVRIAACPSVDYYRSFIYFEYAPMPSVFESWFYKNSDNARESPSRWREKEEYGLFRGRRIITRAEYDDNAASFAGKPVDLDDNVKLRARDLVGGGFCIAPFDSPINNNRFDTVLGELLASVRRDPRKLEELVEAVRLLPKRRIRSS